MCGRRQEFAGNLQTTIIERSGCAHRAPSTTGRHVDRCLCKFCVRLYCLRDVTYALCELTVSRLLVLLSRLRVWLYVQSVIYSVRVRA